MAEEQSVEDAMNAVLLEEEAARSAIAGCEAEAARRLGEAQQQARRIAERTDARISRLHTLCARESNHRIQNLLNEDDGLAEVPPDAHEEEILSAAVTRLAKELTMPAGEQ